MEYWEEIHVKDLPFVDRQSRSIRIWGIKSVKNCMRGEEEQWTMKQEN